jgi:nucleotide-binding universal stress UspA family protein
LDELVHVKSSEARDAIESESAKGYSIVLVGIGQPLCANEQRFDPALASLLAVFRGPVAIAMNGEPFRATSGTPMNILVPTGGTANARMATEFALAFAKATGGRLTVLHVFASQNDIDPLRSGRSNRRGLSVLVDARRLGKRNDIRVDAITGVNARPEVAIRRAVATGQYDLVVLGASLRQGNNKFLGPGSEELVRTLKLPILLVTQ